MEEIHIVIAETLGVNGEFTTEVYPHRNEDDAHKEACELIADMAKMMMMDVDPEKEWELKGEGWFYRVKIFSRNIF